LVFEAGLSYVVPASLELEISPASASRVLIVQVCTVTPGSPKSQKTLLIFKNIQALFITTLMCEHMFTVKSENTGEVYPVAVKVHLVFLQPVEAGGAIPKHKIGHC
jgi:hypothetical protein